MLVFIISILASKAKRDQWLLAEHLQWAPKMTPKRGFNVQQTIYLFNFGLQWPLQTNSQGHIAPNRGSQITVGSILASSKWDSKSLTTFIMEVSKDKASLLKKNKIKFVVAKLKHKYHPHQSLKINLFFSIKYETQVFDYKFKCQLVCFIPSLQMEPSQLATPPNLNN